VCFIHDIAARPQARLLWVLALSLTALRRCPGLEAAP
jgi:hypothetical protein